MAGRTRTTKTLSQRIDREYFKRLYPIPRWRRILSIAFTAIGLAWVLGSTVGNSGAVFNAGPLSKGHHILDNKCASCHTGTALWGRKVEEASCVTCHDGPAHKEQQTSTPGCLSCHVEHKGTLELASVITDSSCTQCHSNLQTKNGKNTVAANVSAFDSSHPEFAPVKAKTADPGTIKFGHQVHMKADLRGPNGPTQLKCATCHNPDRAGQMSIANFKDNCESCHR
ncbi:MAG: cytochrome c3 family protein, partial [Acidobacteriota bacterium]